MALAMSLWYSTRHRPYGIGYVPLVQHKTSALWHWLCPFGTARNAFWCRLRPFDTAQYRCLMVSATLWYSTKCLIVSAMSLWYSTKCLMALATFLWYSTRPMPYGIGYVPLVQHKTLALWHWLCPFGTAQDTHFVASATFLWYSTRLMPYGIVYVPLVQHKTHTLWHVFVPLVQHKTHTLWHWLCPFGTAQDTHLMASAMSLWYSTRHWP